MRSGLLDGLIGDLSYAIRGLARSPGFTAAAVITLALGIGAATAVFSVINTVLLEPLPYTNADRLVRIVQHAAPANPAAPLLRRNDMSQAELTQWRKSTRTLSAMAITITPPITLMPTASGSARLTGSLVSPNIFAMLGAHAQLGRALEPSDSAAGSNLVVISAPAWRRYFQSDPNILGRKITLKTLGPQAGLLDGTPLTIIGVMPSGFDFPQPNSDYWTPISEDSPARERLGGAMIAQLAEGITIGAATDEANAIGESLRPKPTSGPLSRPCQKGCGASW
jgi:putative ABC transport system permease protein